MKAKKLYKLLKTFPNAKIRVWDDDKIEAVITRGDDGTVINLKRRPFECAARNGQG